jgi:hypothetical protein
MKVVSKGTDGDGRKGVRHLALLGCVLIYRLSRRMKPEVNPESEERGEGDE